MRCTAPSSAPLLAVAALAPVVGVLLSLPAIGRRRVLDDHVLELLARGGDPTLPRPGGFDLFRFASGSPEENLRMMSAGSLLPWWSDPQLKITFFRPLSSLLHRLDFALWPRQSELMYAHGLLWLLLVLLLAQRLYRRLEARAGVATLASWLYAMNDANGAVASWLSNRNALLSAAGALGALLLHDRARRQGHLPSRLLAPASLSLSLFAGELGVSAWAYLLAHALAFERDSLRRRVAVLWPYAIVTSIWGCAYVASGAGATGSGVYLHPMVDPGAFARELPARAASLLGAAFGPLPSDLAFVGAAGVMPVVAALAALIVGAVCWVARGELRRDPVARFWWLGTLLAVLPIAASFPSDRLLLLVNVGAMAIVARTLRTAWSRARDAGSARRSAAAGPRALALVLALVHGVLSPVLLPWRAGQMQQLGAATDAAFACLDAVDDLGSKTLVVLGAPADFFVSYLQVERAARGLPRPEHVYWVANPAGSLRARIEDRWTLGLELDGGFFTTQTEALYRGRDARLGPGERVSLPGLEASVGDVDASGAPRSVALRFAEPLGSGRHLFLVLRGAAYERVDAAELGRLEIAQALPLPELLYRSHGGRSHGARAHARSALHQATRDEDRP